MQTAKSTLKLKVPVSAVTPILKKQVVVFDKQVLQDKSVNTKLTKDINPSTSKSTKAGESKAAQAQIKAEKAKALAEEQKAALKAKLVRWKKEVIELEKDNFSKQQIKRFFRRYCSDYRYKKLLVEGAQRFNLDGTKASLVTKEEVPPKTNKFSKLYKS